ncbi:MAG: phosphomannomutase/phosphoglucomutase [Rickettsiales bacterium]|nr:phosphomannomutase/phosphoglucomutase [Rickettsiales bacterium]
MNHKFNNSIIRAYDIRGVYGKTLHDADAFFVGKSFASFLHKNGGKKISVASDGRISSPALKAQLIKALIQSGLEVVDVGIGPTPMLYFSVYHLECDAGIMVTGSHNPKDHNGFKMLLKDRPFFGDDILNLAKLAADGDFVEGKGGLANFDIEDIYVNRVLADCVLAKKHVAKKPARELKIVWDAGNGSAGDAMKKVSQQIKGEHFLLFADIDGTFPNHHPDPTVPKNLEDLKREILAKKCDIGIAFDGDGDRIGVMDDEGEILWGDQLMIFFAREVLARMPDSVIIADVKASQVLFDEIKKAGGKPMMWKTGHSLVKAQMKATKSPLAGEMSGHIFFADKYFAHQNHGYDDALYAAIRIINIVAQSSHKLSDLRKALPQTFSTPEIRVESEDEKKFAIVDQLKNELKNSGLNINDVDGVRITTDKGWWLIRASNTQPVLVARCEASSAKDLEELKSNLRDHLKNLGVKIPHELE